MIHQQPLVSVVTPTYNRPEYLKQALASAVRQTYQNIEIIVVDNCSPESPKPIVDAFQDPRIRFHRNETNLGALANMLISMMMAQGKYVASLHDDNLWHPHFLEKLVPHLEANSDLVLAFSDEYVIDASGSINYQKTKKASRFREKIKEGIYKPFHELLVYEVMPAFSGTVIRREGVDWEAWGNRSNEIGSFMDYYLMYYCCRLGQGAYYVPEKLAMTRDHGGTLTNFGGVDFEGKIKGAKYEISYVKYLLEDENLKPFSSHLLRRLAHAYTSLGIGLIRGNQLVEARSHLLHSLTLNKFNLRTISGLLLSYFPSILLSSK